MEHLTLALPSLALEAAYRDCEADFQRAGETFIGRARTDYAGYVEQSERFRLGRELGDKVPQTEFFLLRDGTTLLGVSGLRHQLNPQLEDIGGHIGYRIRPSERRKGYGTRLLALTLMEARALGLDAVLVTCDSDNLGSRGVIEHTGGRLASESPAYTGVLVARYWIAVPAAGAKP